MSLFSKLRNCAIFLCSLSPFMEHTQHAHTHKLKAYKAATHTHTDNCGTIFNICARRLKICNIFYLFLLHKVLRHKIFFACCHFCRSCCCCCCVTAFIPQCVWLCVCVHVCLLFMTQYGRQAPRTCSWPSSVSFSLSLSGPGSVLGL